MKKKYILNQLFKLFDIYKDFNGKNYRRLNNKNKFIYALMHA